MGGGGTGYGERGMWGGGGVGSLCGERRGHLQGPYGEDGTCYGPYGELGVGVGGPCVGMGRDMCKSLMVKMGLVMGHMGNWGWGWGPCVGMAKDICKSLMVKVGLVMDHLGDWGLGVGGPCVGMGRVICKSLMVKLASTWAIWGFGVGGGGEGRGSLQESYGGIGPCDGPSTG